MIELALQEETLEVVVVYEAQYGDRLTFVRPLESWLEVIEWQEDWVPRFKLANSEV